MAGRIFCVVPPTTFDFGNFTNVQPGTLITTTIAQRINSCDCVSGVLLVRVHAINIATSGDHIDAFLVADGYDTDDPAIEYPATTPQLATVSITSTTTVPSFLCAAIDTTKLADEMKVVITGVRGTVNSNALLAKISVDVLLRDKHGMAPQRLPQSIAFGGYPNYGGFTGYCAWGGQ